MSTVISIRFNEDELQAIEHARSTVENSIPAGSISKHSFMRSLLLNGLAIVVTHLEPLRVLSEPTEGAF